MTGHYIDDRPRAALRLHPFDVGLLVSNPGDNGGDTFAFGNPFNLNRAPQSTPLRPRTLQLRIEHAF